MKSAYILAAAVALVASSVQAQCECDPADSACLGECVGNTNQCISECHSNECYSRCIAYHWPGADPNSASNRWEQPTSTWQQRESSTMWVQPTSSQWNNNGQSSQQWPTSSVWVPSGAPTMGQSTQWSQSGSWPSASTWAPGYSYSGMMPSASASVPASGAAAMTTSQMSKAVVGIAVAAAAYMLQ
ncbi:hypothetical protein MBANPS3_006555 [Mucor bainieri]